MFLCTVIIPCCEYVVFICSRSLDASQSTAGFEIGSRDDSRGAAGSAARSGSCRGHPQRSSLYAAVKVASQAYLERQRKRHWRAELAGQPPLRSASRASSHPPLTRQSKEVFQASKGLEKERVWLHGTLRPTIQVDPRHVQDCEGLGR